MYTKQATLMLRAQGKFINSEQTDLVLRLPTYLHSLLQFHFISHRGITDPGEESGFTKSTGQSRLFNL